MLFVPLVCQAKCLEAGGWKLGFQDVVLFVLLVCQHRYFVGELSMLVLRFCVVCSIGLSS